MKTQLTHHDRADLIGGVIIERGPARLFAEWTWDRRAGCTEGRFVMTGPSGRHSRLIIATDTERLDAHWQRFVRHPLNQQPRR